MNKILSFLMVTVLTAIILLGSSSMAYVYGIEEDGADPSAVGTEISPDGEGQAQGASDTDDPAVSDGGTGGPSADEPESSDTEGDIVNDPNDEAYISYFRFLLESRRFDVVKTWNREPGVDQIKVRIRWKPDYEADAELLHKAITVKGVDEAGISEVLVRYYQVEQPARDAMVKELMDTYLEAKGKPIDEIMRKALTDGYQELVLEILKNKDEDDADNADEAAEEIKGLEGLASNVKVDSEGYCYCEVTISKENGWKETVNNVIAPADADVTETLDIKCEPKIGIKEGTDGFIEKIDIENIIADDEGENEETVLADSQEPPAAEQEAKRNSVETSDSNDLYDWATLMIVSLLALLSLCITKLGLRR